MHGNVFTDVFNRFNVKATISNVFINTVEENLSNYQLVANSTQNSPIIMSL